MSWPPRLLVATHNPGKLREWRVLLAPTGAAIETPAGLGLHAPLETANSYAGNAALKAVAAANTAQMPAIADDTGLEVPALRGAPGLGTAEFAKEHGGWLTAHAALHRRAHAAQPHGEIAAALCCAVALAAPDHAPQVTLARVEGWLQWPPTSAPGPAAVFTTEDPVLADGVLIHRRQAFEQLRHIVEAR